MKRLRMHFENATSFECEADEAVHQLAFLQLRNSLLVQPTLAVRLCGDSTSFGVKAGVCEVIDC